MDERALDNCAHIIVVRSGPRMFGNVDESVCEDRWICCFCGQEGKGQPPETGYDDVVRMFNS